MESVNNDTGEGLGDGVFTEILRQRVPEGGLSVAAADAPTYNYPERNQIEIIPSDKFKPKTIGFHVAIQGPDTISGTHRHSCEAILYILEGSGSSTIDGQEYPWQVGDSIYVPPMAWHSHHAGPEGARVLGMWNVPLMEALGLYVNEEAGDTGHPDAKPSVRTTLHP